MYLCLYLSYPLSVICWRVLSSLGLCFKCVEDTADCTINVSPYIVIVYFRIRACVISLLSCFVWYCDQKSKVGDSCVSGTKAFAKECHCGVDTLHVGCELLYILQI